jgi:hypothetical protein
VRQFPQVIVSCGILAPLMSNQPKILANPYYSGFCRDFYVLDFDQLDGVFRQKQDGKFLTDIDWQEV